MLRLSLGYRDPVLVLDVGHALAVHLVPLRRLPSLLLVRLSLDLVFHLSCIT